MRNLEREIAKLARKSVKELLTSKKKSIKITLKNLEDYLGVQKYRYGEAELGPGKARDHADLVLELGLAELRCASTRTSCGSP